MSFVHSELSVGTQVARPHLMGGILHRIPELPETPPISIFSIRDSSLEGAFNEVSLTFSLLHLLRDWLRRGGLRCATREFSNPFLVNRRESCRISIDRLSFLLRTLLELSIFSCLLPVSSETGSVEFILSPCCFLWSSYLVDEYRAANSYYNVRFELPSYNS